MSVTIISTLPKSTPTSENATIHANETDATSAGLDFASLLLGQIAAPSLPSNTTLESSIQQDSPSTDLSAEVAATDAISGDTASLLASLGIGHITDTHQGTPQTSIEQAKIDNSTALQGTSSLLANGSQRTSADEKAQSAETTLQSVATQTLAADDKPAIFAAQTISPKSDSEIRKSASLETTQNSISAIATSNTNPIATDRDDALALPALPTLIRDQHLVNDFGQEIPKNVPLETAPTNTSAIAASNTNSLATSRDESLSVPTLIRDQHWANDFGQKVVWLATHDKQTAQLTLNPAQMGPIEISLSMDKGNATASFASANAETRNAIETAMPRLREMFASAGIELGQTNVSAESFKQQAGGESGQRSATRWMSDNAILATDSVGTMNTKTFTSMRGNGLVDIFA